MTPEAQNRERSARKRGDGKPFPKGRPGNPGGRPKLPIELRERAQIYSVAALDALHAIATDDSQPAPARVSAAVAVIDRGYGKPTATVVAAVGTLAELVLASMPPAQAACTSAPSDDDAT